MKKLLLVFLILSLSISGCGIKNIAPAKSDIVLSAGFLRGEVFRIGQESCSEMELAIYISALRNRYEKTYGEGLWELQTGDKSIEDSVGDMSLSALSLIKAMKLLAKEKGIVLTKEEEDMADNGAYEFYCQLDSDMVNELSIGMDTIKNMYREFVIAEKIYQHIISDVNPEISDDEARTITVLHILFKDYAIKNGERQELSGQDKKNKLNLAKRTRLLLKQEPEKFEEIAKELSESDKILLSFGKGDTEESFEQAAFNLETDEISDIIYTSEGYEIIKCISTFDKETTEINKKRIVDLRRQQAFEEEYNAFTDKIPMDLNKSAVKRAVELAKSINAENFFEIYDDYFENI